MQYEEIISSVASATGFSKDLVDAAYKAYWKAVREHITSIPLKQDLTDEEFQSYKPNVNIPSIGKFYITLERYHKMKEVDKAIKERKDS